MNLLKQTIENIKPLNKEAEAKAKARLDSLIKPIGSLGRLEELAVQLCAVRGGTENDFSHKELLIFGADNGIYEEGVASAPQNVTPIMMSSFPKGVTGATVLAKRANAGVTVVDVGVKGDLDYGEIINRKIGDGTKNFAKEPAMTRDECVRAIEVGIEIAQKAIDKGATVIGIGEMGIGNTSSSSAVLMGLTGLTADKTVGKGAGLTEEAFTHKKEVLAKALDLHKPNRDDVIDVLSKVGGFDICAMAGGFLCCGSNRVPCVIDGFISAVAALCAFRLGPQVRDYFVPSHSSAEIGFLYIMKELELEPYFNLNMRLGEGSGCPLTFRLIDDAMGIMADMATFEEALIDNSTLVDIRS